MSKAFTKETDNDADDDLEEVDSLPPSTKNYMTPTGFAAMQEELKQLMRVERPKVVEVVSWAAGNGDRSENGDYIYGKKRLREIDRRVRYITKRLQSAEVVDPKRQQGLEQVFFGATVTYYDHGADGVLPTEQSEARSGGKRSVGGLPPKMHKVQIVGVDEANLDEGKVSWISPIAKALLKSREGDEVKLRSPAGLRVLEVVKVEYLL